MGHWYVEKNAYCDYDGNRGIDLKCFEIGPEDEEYIKEKIQEYMTENDIDSIDDLPEQITIRFIDPVDEDDIDIEINVKDHV